MKETEPEETPLSHLDEGGSARMVDVGEKSVTSREASAEATVAMRPDTLGMIADGTLPKGDVFSTARIAAISATKRTAELIPLCHPLRIDSVSLNFEIDEGNSTVRVVSVVRATDRTGVEMEALVCAAVAALTIYDMCKAVERGIEVGRLRLISKSGGKSAWKRKS